jgi:hypothetical protein
VKTFTSPDDLGLFNLSTVFEVCDVGQGNEAIGAEGFDLAPKQDSLMRKNDQGKNHIFVI